MKYLNRGFWFWGRGCWYGSWIYNKTDDHDITEILLKVALNTINLNQIWFWGRGLLSHNASDKWLKIRPLCHKITSIPYSISCAYVLCTIMWLLITRRVKLAMQELLILPLCLYCVFVVVVVVYFILIDEKRRCANNVFLE